MRLYFHKTPTWLKKLYPQFTWKIDSSSKDLFLTFDDGPAMGATDVVLNILDKFNAKATFFVVGDNVRKNPELLKEVSSNGHVIGNHTFNHKSGWGISTDQYREQVELCENIITDTLGRTEGIFRPPYGRITFDQAKKIAKEYQVIMWDILSGDFDQNLNHGFSKKQLMKAGSGSILVFHDNLKYMSNVKTLLPDMLSYYQDQGFKFQTIKKQ